MSNAEVTQKVQDGYRMPKPSTVTDETYAMMLQCWNSTAEKRPTFETLFNFFEYYNISTEASYCQTEEY